MSISKGNVFKEKDENNKAKVSKKTKSIQNVERAAQEKFAPKIQNKIDKATSELEELESKKYLGLAMNIYRRYNRIGGSDLSGLLTLEFFSALVPILIIGVSAISTLSNNLHLGDILAEGFELKGKPAQIMHEAFPDGSNLKSYYTLFGILSFVIWLIPLGTQMSKIYSKAFDYNLNTKTENTKSGLLWLSIYVASVLLPILISEYVFEDTKYTYVPLRLIFVFALWYVTPWILMGKYEIGAKFLLKFATMGLVLDGILTFIIIRIAFPLFLNSWEDFSAIGVAMSLLSWCLVTSYIWVIIASIGGEYATRYKETTESISK